jgi:hypothetical protein
LQTIVSMVILAERLMGLHASKQSGVHVCQPNPVAIIFMSLRLQVNLYLHLVQD